MRPVGDVPMQKQTAAQAKEKTVRTKVRRLPRILRDRVHKTLVEIVIAEDEMKLRVGIGTDELIQPVDRRFDRTFGTPHGGPMEVENIPPQDKMPGLSRGGFDGGVMVPRERTLGLQMQIGDEKRRTVHTVNIRHGHK